MGDFKLSEKYGVEALRVRRKIFSEKLGLKKENMAIFESLEVFFKPNIEL